MLNEADIEDRLAETQRNWARKVVETNIFLEVLWFTWQNDLDSNSYFKTPPLASTNPRLILFPSTV